MSSETINLKLKVWRQNGPKDKGHFENYLAKNVDVNASFLEMLDVINTGIIKDGGEPIVFEHDCREGICGSCGAMVNGKAHGPQSRVTLCQLHMRQFKDGETLVIEPFRANAFPVLKDLMVDRTSFDNIISSGGFISVNTGNACDANALPIGKDDADKSFDAAACIGCGACVAACPNASASLFTSAKISHLELLPQGKAEAKRRVVTMVDQMDEEGFGHCTNTYHCEGACPKEISVENISRMNKSYLKAKINS